MPTHSTELAPLLASRRQFTLGLAAIAAGSLTAREIKAADSTQTKRITLAFYADIHGQLEEHPEMYWSSGKDEIVPAGGIARIAHVLRAIRAENPQGTVTLDLGDTIQGSGHVAASEGQTMIEPVNALQLDYWLPGNWEVVFGKDRLLQISRQLKAPALAANLRDAGTKELLFAPCVIHQTQGLKIALIGFTDPDVPHRQPPTFSAGLVYENSEVLQPLIDKVRQQERADLVVLVTHIGLPKAIGLAEALTGVDVILSADTHERTDKPVVRNGVWVVEAGAFGSHVGRLDLLVEDKTIASREWKLIELRADAHGEAEDVRAIVERSLAPTREQFAQVIGSAGTDLFRYAPIECNADAVLADALLATGGTQIALTNGFRFGYPIVKGDITMEDLWNYYPINTNLKTGRVTGAQLRAFFERELENVFSKNPKRLFGGWVPRASSGLEFQFYVNRPEGERITRMTLHGQPVEPLQTYTLTSCEREGDPAHMLCRIPHVEDLKTLDIDAHEAVRRYLKAQSPVTMDQPGRAIPLDVKPNLRSQFLS